MQNSMTTNLYPFFIHVQNRVEEYQAVPRFIYFFALAERTKPNIIPSVNSTADFATCVSNYRSIIEKNIQLTLLLLERIIYISYLFYFNVCRTKVLKTLYWVHIDVV